MEDQLIFQKDAKMLFFFVLPSSLFQIFLLLLVGRKGALKRLLLSFTFPVFQQFYSRCLFVIDVVTKSHDLQQAIPVTFYSGYASTHLVSYLYKNCMQLLICFQVIFSYLALGELSVLVCLQWFVFNGYLLCFI